ncbi:MAG: helix-turn-helix transcriptional regulator [Dermatophilaceae bacterium]
MSTSADNLIHMRADRLLAALLLLQQRGRVTAGELAAELEVSVPTARRDLAALSAAGIPVYAQPGRGGGWQLVGGARTDLSGLSAPEAQALFLLLGPAAAVSDEARSALRKLVRALPSTFREPAAAAATATLVDPARWGEPERTGTPLVDLLQSAVVARRRVRMTYAGRRSGVTARVVEPLGMVDKDDVWYLVAATPAGRRTFRVDRISDAAPLASTFEPPAGFDLAEAWEEVVDAMEALRSRTWATVAVETRWLGVLARQFGRHCEVEPNDALEAADRSWVRVGAPTVLDIARTLAGWGGAIEVIEPTEVRAELARIGRELAEQYV